MGINTIKIFSPQSTYPTNGYAFDVEPFHSPGREAVMSDHMEPPRLAYVDEVWNLGRAKATLEAADLFASFEQFWKEVINPADLTNYATKAVYYVNGVEKMAIGIDSHETFMVEAVEVVEHHDTGQSLWEFNLTIRGRIPKSGSDKVTSLSQEIEIEYNEAGRVKKTLTSDVMVAMEDGPASGVDVLSLMTHSTFGPVLKLTKPLNAFWLTSGPQNLDVSGYNASEQATGDYKGKRNQATFVCSYQEVGCPVPPEVYNIDYNVATVNDGGQFFYTVTITAQGPGAEAYIRSEAAIAGNVFQEFRIENACFADIWGLFYKKGGSAPGVDDITETSEELDPTRPVVISRELNWAGGGSDRVMQYIPPKWVRIRRTMPSPLVFQVKLTMVTSGSADVEPVDIGFPPPIWPDNLQGGSSTGAWVPDQPGASAGEVVWRRQAVRRYMFGPREIPTRQSTWDSLRDLTGQVTDAEWEINSLAGTLNA